MTSRVSRWYIEAFEKKMDDALSYYTKNLDDDEKGSAENFLRAVTSASLAAKLDLPFLGAPIKHYPPWHPFEYEFSEGGNLADIYGDHALFFANGVISCPYTEREVQIIEQSVQGLMERYQERRQAEQRKNALRYRNAREDYYILQTMRLDVKLYAESAHPVAVWFEWPLTFPGGRLPQNAALSKVLLERLKKKLRVGDNYCLELWRTLAPLFLRELLAVGDRYTSDDIYEDISVDLGTAEAMKEMWGEMIGSGIFGPIYSGAVRSSPLTENGWGAV